MQELRNSDQPPLVMHSKDSLLASIVDDAIMIHAMEQSGHDFVENCYRKPTSDPRVVSPSSEKMVDRGHPEDNLHTWTGLL